MTEEEILNIARVCHEAHRAWCAANGDREHKPWEEAEQYQRDTTIWGIDLLIRFPDVSDQRHPRRMVEREDRRGLEVRPRPRSRRQNPSRHGSLFRDGILPAQEEAFIQGHRHGVARQMKIGLVQINNSFSGQNYLPYSVALLQAYVEKHAPGKHEFLPLVYKRAAIDSIVQSLVTADLVGFSIYVWNERISLEIARRLKVIKPEIITVFGGPQVPDKPEAWLVSNPQIDRVIHNEGERAFLALVEGIDDNAQALRFMRLNDLDEIPSPFLEGTFDSLIAANPDEKWIGLWETNRGCPFRCTFCDWGSATAAKVTKFGMERLQAEVDWFARHRIEYIFCCDANFGIQKRDVDIAKHVAKVKQQTGYPHALSVQNTKNATERAYETQKILSDAGLNKGVALRCSRWTPALSLLSSETTYLWEPTLNSNSDSPEITLRLIQT